MKQSFTWIVVTILTFLSACSSDNDGFPGEEPTEVSPVVLDLNAIPYQKLSDYNLFKTPLVELQPVYGVIPYEPISALFSDYASKKRFLWMPEGKSATYNSDGTTLDFPVGTILVKNFYYENTLPDMSKRLLETRIMVKKESEWTFYNYVWNEDQSEAYFDLNGKFVPINFMHNGVEKEVNYRIPNGAECLSCHNIADVPMPIGTKPQSLNKNFNYPEGSVNQLEKLKQFGYLVNFPNQINTVINYSDTSQPLELRVRSYLDINCSHCHSDQGFCNYRKPRFGFNRTSEDPQNFGICVEPDEDITPWVNGGEPTHIIRPGHHENSAIYYRLNTTLENIRMPLRGRTIIHEEAVEMVSQWIDSLENSNCE